MKNKPHRDLPCKPFCWVGGSRIIHMAALCDDTIEKYAVAKVMLVIKKAMRK